jgi:hypothetical protein
VRRGRVDETKAAADELTKVDAVAKGGDDRGLGEGFGGVGDPKAETRTRTKRKRGFFFYMSSAREDGNVDNAVRDDGGGISMVHWCGLKTC